MAKLFLLRIAFGFKGEIKIIVSDANVCIFACSCVQIHSSDLVSVMVSDKVC